MASEPIILTGPDAQAAYCTQLRLDAGKTQAEVAQMLGYRHAQAVSNAENPADVSRTSTRIAIIKTLRPKASVEEAIVVQE